MNEFCLSQICFSRRPNPSYDNLNMRGPDEEQGPLVATNVTPPCDV